MDADSELRRSKFPDVEVSAEWKDSLSLFYWRRLDQHAQRTLLVDVASGRQWTGAQLKATAATIARQLVEGPARLAARDSCVFFYPHGDHLQLAALGVLFAGGSVCVGARDDPPPEHAHMLECLQPKLVFADGRLAHELAELRANSAGKLTYKLCIMNDHEPAYSGLVAAQPAPQPGQPPAPIGLHSHLLRAPAGAPSCQLPVLVAGDTPAYVLLTSGSTGLPKPVGRSQRNSLHVCHSLQGAEELWELTGDSVLAGHLPLDHGTGTFSIKMCIALGLKLVLMDGYQEGAMLDAIEQHAITDIMLGSAYLHRLMESPALAGRKLDSLRNLLAVGSPLSSHELAGRFMDAHPNVSVRAAFGMTECGFLAMVGRAEARAEPGPVGWLLPNVRMKLLDPDDGRTPVRGPQQVGELYVGGPTVSPGYMGAQLAEQTRAAFLADGFYRSRDLACFTADGRLCIRGRHCEVLCLTDGWKVLPHEIELVLRRHPEVADVAVLGIPHPDLPTCHAPRAYVVPRARAAAAGLPERLAEFARQQLSEPKQLAGGVRVMEELPRVTLGKVDRKQLRRLDGY